MGHAKALLEWDGATLIEHIVAIVAGVVDGPLIVMRTPGQDLPPLPGAVLVMDDQRHGQGPLAALATALAVAHPLATTALVCPVDMPFLSPTFLRSLHATLTAHDEMAVATYRDRRLPLPAVLRCSLAARSAALVASGHRALMELVAASHVAALEGQALHAADPDGLCLRNLNTRGEYHDALHTAERMGYTGSG